MASRFTGSGGLASRYATAIYELAEDEKSLDRVAEDLRDLKGLIAENDDLAHLIASPRFGRGEQARAIGAVLEQAKAHKLTQRFVAVIAGNRRLLALVSIIDAFLAQLARRRGEVTAEVTSATKLPEKQVQALIAVLKKIVGAKVSVDLKVDPDILGGLVVRVGSRMFDSSLRSKLLKMRLAMKGTGQ